MANANWGVKRVCPGCSTRYYDMKKTPPTCPKCSTVFDPEALLRMRKRAIPEDTKPKRAEVVAVVEEVVVEDAAEGDAEEAVIEDAEELEAGGEIEEVAEIPEEEEAR